jgi:hypothetical protein
VHNGPQNVTKASTGSKSGHIRTLISRHASDAVELTQNTTVGFMDMDGMMEFPLIAMENDGDQIPMPCVSGIRVKSKAKRYQNLVRLFTTEHACYLLMLDQDHPLLTWVNYCEVYLDGHLCLEGRGVFQGIGCVVCGEAEPTYRCRSCFGARMHCRSCILGAHADEPLHILEV